MPPTDTGPSPRASVPQEILLERLVDGADPFTITPLPAGEHIGKGSIDLRLGTYYKTARRSSVESLSPDSGELPERLFEDRRVAPGHHTIIHPGQLVLASTLEYLSLPNDLCGIIQSRSSFGRMGLVAATAAWVGPGYKGCPTLEVVNLGDLPVKVTPYLATCQLVVFYADENDVRPSRYQCAVKPGYAQWTRDKYVDMWSPSSEDDVLRQPPQ